MPDVVVEEKVVVRLSRLIKDNQTPVTGPGLTTINTRFYLQDSVLGPVINDPEVTITTSIIPKSNLLNVNSI